MSVVSKKRGRELAERPSKDCKDCYARPQIRPLTIEPFNRRKALDNRRTAPGLLRAAFRPEKVSSKGLNDAFYANLGWQIKTLPWCDHGRTRDTWTARARYDLESPMRAQLQAIKPTLERIFAKDRDSGIAQAYREHGYRLHEIAAHLGVHYATVSRKLKQIERRT